MNRYLLAAGGCIALLAAAVAVSLAAPPRSSAASLDAPRPMGEVAPAATSRGPAPSSTDGGPRETASSTPLPGVAASAATPPPADSSSGSRADPLDLEVLEEAFSELYRDATIDDLILIHTALVQALPPDLGREQHRAKLAAGESELLGKAEIDSEGRRAFSVGPEEMARRRHVLDLTHHLLSGEVRKTEIELASLGADAPRVFEVNWLLNEIRGRTSKRKSSTHSSGG